MWLLINFNNIVKYLLIHGWNIDGRHIKSCPIQARPLAQLLNNLHHDTLQKKKKKKLRWFHLPSTLY